jgi:predicted nucleic acid-binding protein
MTVIDASAVVNLLLRPRENHASRSLLDDDLRAPSILIPEVTNAIKKHVSFRTLSGQAARKKIALLSMLPVDLVHTQRLSLHIWDLARTFSTYDACYVSLAMHLDDTLITSDRKLANEARRHVTVQFLDPSTLD